MTPEPAQKATAAIDPPLFAGLFMFSTALVPVFGVLHGAEYFTRHPDVNRAFVLKAFDLERVNELFSSPVVPGGLARALVEASMVSPLVIKDRTVDVYGPLALLGNTGTGEEDAAPDEATIERSKSIAGALSRFAETMQPRPAEIEGRARWSDLAAQLGLSFDPRRWHLFGNFDGIEVSVSLEGSPPGVSTSFRARWRRPLACGIVLRRGFRQRVGFTTWKDGDPPGFPELDAVTVMDARDPERARAILADQPVRSAIAGIAAEANFVLDDRAITVGRGGFAGRTEIRQRLEELRWLVDRVTPAMGGGSPFR